LLRRTASADALHPAMSVTAAAREFRMRKCDDGPLYASNAPMAGAVFVAISRATADKKQA
jgi:hypothetical protein